MFTLKLYRRKNQQLQQKIITVDHVRVMELSDSAMFEGRKALEILAFPRTNENFIYQHYFIGDIPPPSMSSPDSIDREGMDDMSAWGWAFLENEAGRTTERFTPHSYG